MSAADRERALNAKFFEFLDHLASAQQQLTRIQVWGEALLQAQQNTPVKEDDQ